MVDININKDKDFELISVIGEVDASSSIELDNALSECLKAEKNILVDLTKLEYISSAGLGVFISYIQDIKAKSLNLVLFGLEPKVDEVFKILGLHDIMSIVTNKEEALDLIK